MIETMNQETFLSPEDMEQFVPGTTRGYWAQLRYGGGGPKFLKPSPRRVLYRKSDVMAWLATREYTRTDQPVSRENK